jgi:hypothetical protein
MVEDENHRRIERYMLDTRDLDALKVNPQRKPHDGNYDATNHPYLFTNPCSSVAQFSGLMQ